MLTKYTNIHELITNSGIVEKRGIGIEEVDLGIIQDGVLVMDDGNILYAGHTYECPSKYDDIQKENLHGAVVIPALIDPSTHFVFGGSRHHDFALYSEGADSEAITSAGGGLNAIVSATRALTADELVKKTEPLLVESRRFGVTAVEIKSGFGLNLESEMMILNVISKLRRETKQRIVATLFTGHALPPESSHDQKSYIDLVVGEIIPTAADAKLADYLSVYLGHEAFTAEDIKRIITTGIDSGLKIRAYADAGASYELIKLALDMGVQFFDNCRNLDEKAMPPLRDKNATAILLPNISFFLQKDYPPARSMLNAGIRVAIATGCNPGYGFTQNLPYIMSLACTQLKMTVPEVFAAVTYNAAYAIGLESELGAITAGRRTPVLALPIPTYEYLPYHVAAYPKGRLIW